MKYKVKHFTEKERRCKCGCGEMATDVEFLKLMDKLRDMFGGPIKITSWYRCPAYNARISRTGRTGPHTTGTAVDIPVSGKRVYKMLKIAYKLGFKGIGLKQKGPHARRFMHLDTVEEGTRPWIWTY